jgi:putative endonuclease
MPYFHPKMAPVKAGIQPKLSKMPNMEKFSNKKVFGAWGEQIAADYLESLGYKIISRNYRCRYGEIDLVCTDGPVWSFVEVKTRKSFRYGDGLQAITAHKRKNMTRVALYFLNQSNIPEAISRFDVVAIDYRSAIDYRICLVQNAFA